MHADSGRDGPGVKLVSFTVDPARDTPQALDGIREKVFRRRLALDVSDRRPGTLDMLDHDAFKLGNLNMDHSTRFVLIDKAGRVRGYYGLFDGDPVAKLKKDAARLESEPRA